MLGCKAGHLLIQPPPHPGNTQPSLSEYAPPDPLIYTAGSKGRGTDIMIFLSQGIRIFHTPSPLLASQPQPALPRHTPYRTPAGPTDCHLLHTTNPKPAPSGPHTASTRAHHPRAAMVVGPTTTPGSQPSPTGNPTDSTKAQGIHTVSLAVRVWHPLSPFPSFDNPATTRLHSRDQDAGIGIGIETASARLVTHSQASPIKAAADHWKRTTWCSYSSYCVQTVPRSLSTCPCPSVPLLPVRRPQPCKRRQRPKLTPIFPLPLPRQLSHQLAIDPLRPLDRRLTSSCTPL